MHFRDPKMNTGVFWERVEGCFTNQMKTVRRSSSVVNAIFLLTDPEQFQTDVRQPRFVRPTGGTMAALQSRQATTQKTSLLSA